MKYLWEALTNKNLPLKFPKEKIDIKICSNGHSKFERPSTDGYQPNN